VGIKRLAGRARARPGSRLRTICQTASVRRRADAAWVALMLLNIAAIGIWQYWDTLAGILLLAVMFVVTARHASRKIAADRERKVLDEQNTRLIDARRRFVEDTPHHLRTPLTIALAHAELLARDLSGRELSDIQTVAGEIVRLRRLSERLSVIAAADNTDSTDVMCVGEPGGPAHRR
jgi:signal transduction histidine kinase